MKDYCLKALVIISFASIVFGCQRKKYRDGFSDQTNSYYEEVNARDRSYDEERNIRRGTKVHMKQDSGVYLVPITVNNLQLEFIFDTGASSICISAAEAAVMIRQGKITDEDILGQQQFQNATGGVSVGTIVRLRTVDIGGITLHNIEANVVDNIQAPLLLGQTALSKFGKVTIDYNNNTIEFN